MPPNFRRSAISLLSSPPRNPGVSRMPSYFRTSVDALELDATLSETHSSESEVTEHPVETGSNIVDHVRPKPESLTLEGIISNTPVDEKTRTKVGKAVKGATGRAEAALIALRRMRDEGRLVIVATRHRTYSNMVLVSLSVPRDAKLGDVVRFSATFKQVRIVSTRMTDVLVPTAKRTAKKKADLGPQATKPADTYVRGKSIAKTFQEGGLDALKQKFLGGSK